MVSECELQDFSILTSESGIAIPTHCYFTHILLPVNCSMAIWITPSWHLSMLSLTDSHPLPVCRLLALAHSRANKLKSATAAGCQLGALTAIWGARLSKSSPAGTSGRGRMSSAPLIHSDSDGQVQRGEMMAKVFLLSGQCLKRWTWRSQNLKVQLCVCVCVWAHALVPVPECWCGCA